MLYRILRAKKVTSIIVFVQCVLIILEIFSFVGLFNLYNNYQKIVKENATFSKTLSETTILAHNLQEYENSSINWNINSKNLLTNLNEYRLYSVKTNNDDLNSEINLLINQFNEIDASISTSGTSELSSIFEENVDSISSYISRSFEKEKTKSANLLFILGGFIILAGLLLVFVHLYCLISLLAPISGDSYNYNNISPSSEANYIYKSLLIEDKIILSDEPDEDEPDINYKKEKEKMNVA